MVVLNVSNLKKSYPIKDIFDKVSFKIEKGEKVGLIGVNGSGKTTLFNILTNNLSKDGGDIFVPNDVTIGYLKQQLSINSTLSVREHCLKVFEDIFKIEANLRKLEQKMAQITDNDHLDDIMNQYSKLNDEFEKKNGYAYKSEISGALKGLGFSEEDFDKSVNTLSGGQKARLELAILMLKKPDLILLDEPTNHLDIEAINFLENFIKGFDGSVIVISHDRYFLDNTVNKILLLEHRSLRNYNSNYTDFMALRKKEIADYRHRYEMQQKEIKRQEEIIERFKNLGGSKRDRGISQSRSRQKLLDKMERIEKPDFDNNTMSIRFSPRITSGKDVLKVQDLSKSFNQKQIFKNINFEIFRSDKVCIIGKNGVGKTTIFKMIIGQLKKDSGKIKIGTGVNIGYFDQEQKSLNKENTVIEEIWNEYPMMTNFEIRSNLAKLMFYEDDVFRLVKDLSGGERARLNLLKIMLSNANFILMDEPTNHLDIDSKEILEDAILNYDGTVLVISHDRYFINKVANKIIHMKEDESFEYLGNYDYFVKKQKELNEQEEQKPTKTKTQEKKEIRKDKDRKRNISKIKKEIKKIEDQIQKKQKEKDKLTEMTYETSFYENNENVLKVFADIRKIDEDIESLNEKWLEFSEKLETLLFE
ncbi:MAG: ABC-F family ATP-binding cassette domain-containing protein [Tissierellia bacterium]|nr:ABC-F family ATP-binding cassette domain-containing protein [Tissierellia bacterium]